MSSLTFVRKDELAKELGVSKTTLWRMQNRGEIPAPTILSSRVVGWRRELIESWLLSKESTQ